MNEFIKKNRWLIVLMHVLVWSVLFSLPYLLSSGVEYSLERTLEHLWIPLCFYAVLFYLNYFGLADALLVKRKPLVFWVVNLLLIAAFIWLKFLIRDMIFNLIPDPNRNERAAPPLSFFVYIDALSLIIPVIFAVALRVFERYLTTESEKKLSENARLESELQHLKYQLQPHFFFNSLNNIYSLVDISPDKAKETIHSLGTLMRYLLYDTSVGEISLKKEISFMEKYIDLMRLRTSDKTQITTDFPLVLDEVKIAPLLFISLIENAFKHGVSAVSPSQISFSLVLSDGVMRFKSSNGNFGKSSTDKSGSGIGLANIRKRLDLLYPGKHRFEITETGDRFETHLEIQLG